MDDVTYKVLTLEQKEAYVRRLRRQPSMCPKCGEKEAHFAGPSFGEEGFYICDRMGVAGAEL